MISLPVGLALGPVLKALHSLPPVSHCSFTWSKTTDGITYTGYCKHTLCLCPSWCLFDWRIYYFSHKWTPLWCWVLGTCWQMRQTQTLTSETTEPYRKLLWTYIKCVSPWFPSIDILFLFSIFYLFVEVCFKFFSSVQPLLLALSLPWHFIAVIPKALCGSCWVQCYGQAMWFNFQNDTIK